MAKSFDIALPSFLMEDENQLYVLASVFVTLVMIPLAILAKTKDGNDPNDMFFENGVHKSSPALMSKVLLDVLDKNKRKKIKTISDEQFMEIFENSVELMKVNYDLKKKVVLSDLIKQKIQNHKIAEKFAEVDL